jgi:Arc/MetJ-type ribon-helix-helix transcriptional regulator
MAATRTKRSKGIFTSPGDPSNKPKSSPNAWKKNENLTSIALTPDTNAAIERLRQDTQDRLGRRISTSAVIRALLRYASQQKDIASVVDSLISKELAAGIRWGKPRQKRKA